MTLQQERQLSSSLLRNWIAGNEEKTNRRAFTENKSPTYANCFWSAIATFIAWRWIISCCHWLSLGTFDLNLPALLTHIRFETRMILLSGFLHFCRVYKYSNQKPLLWESFPRRFSKKMKNSRSFASFCIDYFSGWFDLFLDSIMLILIRFPFIW